jgi:hypothetical protein
MTAVLTICLFWSTPCSLRPVFAMNLWQELFLSNGIEARYVNC